MATNLHGGFAENKRVGGVGGVVGNRVEDGLGLESIPSDDLRGRRLGTRVEPASAKSVSGG